MSLKRLKLFLRGIMFLNKCMTLPKMFLNILGLHLVCLYGRRARCYLASKSSSCVRTAAVITAVVIAAVLAVVLLGLVVIAVVAVVCRSRRPLLADDDTATEYSDRVSGGNPPGMLWLEGNDSMRKLPAGQLDSYKMAAKQSALVVSHCCNQEPATACVWHRHSCDTVRPL